MVPELLSRVKGIVRHIIPLFLLCLSSSVALAQTLLLPGDILISTVNSSNSTIDIVPMVDLNPTTSLWIASKNGEQFTGYAEISINKRVNAGEVLRITNTSDDRFNAIIKSENLGSEIVLIQKDEGIDRFIFGVSIGNDSISDLPESLTNSSGSFVNVPSGSNHQYHLRNGVSGTLEMLQDLVTDPAHWRSSDDLPFPVPGTNFRLLEAPVVMFDRTIDYVTEGDSIELNVAVYGHDGSRLTVDVAMNAWNSTADTSDLPDFRSVTFNFTGLIGDAVYAVTVPVSDDEQYEGTESLFFELKNLSKGHFGDFVSQAVLINDNEMPNIIVRKAEVTGDSDSDVVELQNLEDAVVDLDGWKLLINGFGYEFGQQDFLEPKGRLQISGLQQLADQKSSKGKIQLLDENGLLVLNDRSNMIVKSVNTKPERTVSTAVSGNPSTTDIGATPLSGTLTASGTSASQINIEETPFTPGWYPISREDVFSYKMAMNELYSWNEAKGKFVRINDEIPQTGTNTLQFYYRPERDTTTINQSDTLSETSAGAPWKFSLTATDANENGIIDGVEGFNLLQNNSGDTLRVDQFMQTVTQLSGYRSLRPVIYEVSSPGSLFEDLQAKQKHEIIPPNALFWVQADSLNSSFTIEYDPALTSYLPAESEEIIEEEVPTVSIMLSNGKQKEEISIHFTPAQEQLLYEDHLQLPMILGYKPDNPGFIYLGMQDGNSWKETWNIETSETQKITVPIGFVTDLKGEFRINIIEANGLPAEWRLFVEDQKTEEITEVYKGWEKKFDYSPSHYLKQNEKEAEFEPVEMNETDIDDRFRFIMVPPGVSETEIDKPDEVQLHQNYPNPFNPATTISIYLPESLPVKLSVFNIVGQPVAVLAEGVLPGGDHEFEWDATGLPSGMYIYQLEVGANIFTRKMTLVK